MSVLAKISLANEYYCFIIHRFGTVFLLVCTQENQFRFTHVTLRNSATYKISKKKKSGSCERSFDVSRRCQQ